MGVARAPQRVFGAVRDLTGKIKARAEPVWARANPNAPRSRASAAVGSPLGPLSAVVRREDVLAISAARSRSGPDDQCSTRSSMGGKSVSSGSVRVGAPQRPPTTSARGGGGMSAKRFPSRGAQRSPSGGACIVGSLAPSTATQAPVIRVSSAPTARASATNAAVDMPQPAPGGRSTWMSICKAGSTPNTSRNRRQMLSVITG